MKWRSHLITDFYEQINKLEDDEDDGYDNTIYRSYASPEDMKGIKKGQKPRIIFR